MDIFPTFVFNNIARLSFIFSPRVFHALSPPKRLIVLNSATCIFARVMVNVTKSIYYHQHRERTDRFLRVICVSEWQGDPSSSVGSPETLLKRATDVPPVREARPGCSWDHWSVPPFEASGLLLGVQILTKAARVAKKHLCFCAKCLATRQKCRLLCRTFCHTVLCFHIHFRIDLHF